MSTIPNPSWGNNSSDRLGYDGAGRTITKRYVSSTLSSGAYSDATSIVGFTTAYDLAFNKRYERHLHAENRSHLYPTLDSMNRLREYQRGTLALDSGGYDVAVSSAITLAGTDTQRTYRLDGLGNWQRTAYTPEGGSLTTEVRRHNSANQVTEFAGTDVAYDHGDNSGDDAAQGNGNIIDDDTRLYKYDALNRVVEVKRKSDDEIIGQYTYDALGRRIRRVIPVIADSKGGLTGEIPADTTDYLYNGAQCVEERNDSDVIQRQYVWGRYVDELIQQKDLVAPTGTYYMLSDLLYRAAALYDTSLGDPKFKEAYDCDAYGNTQIFADGESHRANWFTDADEGYVTNNPKCQFIFTGRRFDPETSDATTQMYYYRARYYSPVLGRFISRDPIDYAGGMNLYEYVGGGAVDAGDPMGLTRYQKDTADRSIADVQRIVGAKVTGIYDTPTRAAVRIYQAYLRATQSPGDTPIKLDGKWGDNTERTHLAQVLAGGKTQAEHEACPKKDPCKPATAKPAVQSAEDSLREYLGLLHPVRSKAKFPFPIISLVQPVPRGNVVLSCHQPYGYVAPPWSGSIGIMLSGSLVSPVGGARLGLNLHLDFDNPGNTGLYVVPGIGVGLDIGASLSGYYAEGTKGNAWGGDQPFTGLEANLGPIQGSWFKSDSGIQGGSGGLTIGFPLGASVNQDYFIPVIGGQQ